MGGVTASTYVNDCMESSSNAMPMQRDTASYLDPGLELSLAEATSPAGESVPSLGRDGQRCLQAKLPASVSQGLNHASVPALDTKRTYVRGAVELWRGSAMSLFDRTTFQMTDTR